MRPMDIFKYIKAKQFFPKYAPGVTNWTHKMRRVSGNKGRPINFSDGDFEMITDGIIKMCEDLKVTTDLGVLC